MAKVKNWLFSMQAKGHLGHQLTGQGSLGGQRVQPYRKPGGKPSERQDARRSNWKEGMKFWRGALYSSEGTWDAWNVSRSIAGNKETSLSLFMRQWDKTNFYAKNYYELVLTKAKVVTKDGIYWVEPEDGDSWPIFPVAAEAEIYYPQENKRYIQFFIVGPVIGEDWDVSTDMYGEVPLTGDIEYCIVYGKYSDGFTESEEFPIMPVVTKNHIWNQ